MNECKVCGNECNGNTCSGACRAKLSRRTRTVETEAHAHAGDGRTQEAHAGQLNSIPVNRIKDNAPLPLTMDSVITASLQHYEDNPDMYADRTDGVALNWGKWLDSDSLKQHGFTANRRPIPGDWDYEGRRELVEGKWQVCV